MIQNLHFQLNNIYNFHIQFNVSLHRTFIAHLELLSMVHICRKKKTHKLDARGRYSAENALYCNFVVADIFISLWRSPM